MSNISAWSSAAASNTASPPDGAPEGMAPSTVNNTIREVMAAVRRYYEDAEFRDLGHTVVRQSATVFRISGADYTSIYSALRPIRCHDGVVSRGEVTSSTYSSGNTDVTVNLDSGSLTSSLSAVAVGHLNLIEDLRPHPWQFQQYFERETLSDAASITWNLNTQPSATVTLGGNRTLEAPTNMKNGGNYQLIVKQDGTGNRTLTFASVYKWQGGTAPVLTSASASVDILSFTSDGSSMFGSVVRDVR